MYWVTYLLDQQNFTNLHRTAFLDRYTYEILEIKDLIKQDSCLVNSTSTAVSSVDRTIVLQSGDVCFLVVTARLAEYLLPPWLLVRQLPFIQERGAKKIGLPSWSSKLPRISSTFYSVCKWFWRDVFLCCCFCFCCCCSVFILGHIVLLWRVLNILSSSSQVLPEFCSL